MKPLADILAELATNLRTEFDRSAPADATLSARYSRAGIERGGGRCTRAKSAAVPRPGELVDLRGVDLGVQKEAAPEAEDEATA